MPVARMMPRLRERERTVLTHHGGVGDVAGVHSGNRTSTSDRVRARRGRCEREPPPAGVVDSVPIDRCRPDRRDSADDGTTIPARISSVPAT